jgi:hypothetical protein
MFHDAFVYSSGLGRVQGTKNDGHQKEISSFMIFPRGGAEIDHMGFYSIHVDLGIDLADILTHGFVCDTGLGRESSSEYAVHPK